MKSKFRVILLFLNIFFLRLWPYLFIKNVKYWLSILLAPNTIPALLFIYSEWCYLFIHVDSEIPDVIAKFTIKILNIYLVVNC